jgi:hypothetical protein
MMTNPESQRDSADRCHGEARQSGRRVVAARFGVALILLSGVLWFSLFAIPFLPLTVGQKAALAGADFVGVQIAWWAGAALAGPQFVARLKSRFGKKKTTDES